MKFPQAKRWIENVPLFVTSVALAPCVRFLSRLIAGERTALIHVLGSAND